MNKIFNQRVVLSVLNLGLILMLVIVAVAQNSTTSTPSATSNSLGDVSGIGKQEFSSLYDGSLNFNLPLLNIGGRGSVGYSPNLKFKQEWSVDTSYDPHANHNHPQNPTDPYFTFTYKYSGTDTHSFGSLYIGYGPGVITVKREKSKRYSGNQYNGLSRIIFTGQNGSTELIDDLWKGEKRPITNVPNTGISRGRFFTSYDGSSVKFISDTNISDLGPTDVCFEGFPSCGEVYRPSGYIKFDNGGEYRVENGYITLMKDRNGNGLFFSYDSSGKVTSVTDSLKRVVQFEYDVQDVEPFGLCDRITYKGFGGASRVVRVSKKQLNDALKNGETLFSGFGTGYNYVPIPKVISSVWSPDGRSQTFKYNGYGELARIEYPTGGVVEYDYQPVSDAQDILGFVFNGDVYGGSGPDHAFNPPYVNYAYIYRQMTEKRVYSQGNILENKQTYNVQDYYSPSGGETVSTVDTFDGQTGNKLAVTRHYLKGNVSYSKQAGGEAFDYRNWRDGKEYKTEILSPSTASVLKRSESDWQRGGYFTWSDGTQLDINPRVAESRSFDVPSNLQTKTTYSYDQYNNVIDTFEYDYGVGQAGQFLRRSHTNYVDLGEYLRRIPTQSWVSSDIAGSNKVALTQYEYDNYSTYPLVDRYNVVGHDTANYGTSKTIRGNVTKTTSYTDAQNQTGAITSKAQYDILGNVVKTIDPKGNASTIDYADRFGSPDGEARSNSAPSQLNGQNTFTFATSATNVLGYTAYSQIDYWTGLNVNTEDINGIISKSLYNDPLDRPTQTVSAVGTTKEIQSNIIYDDEHRRIETKSDLFALNDNLTKSETFYDSLGRTFENRRYENGGYIVAKTEFDSLGRTKRVTNPYRPWQNETAVWTEVFYDELGRTIKTKTPDNAEVITEYGANYITVTDQSGRKRRSISNAQGVVRVDEPNAQGELGDVTNPNQPTHYQYNTLGNLVKVTQGNQNRYFLYNSIGQLVRVRQPEQGTNPSLAKTDPITGNNDWSTGSTYDVTGEVLTTTDAKGVTISNTYDISTRPLTTTYSDNTPAVSYVYDDSSIPFSKSKLTKITNGISTTEYTSFDNLGRLLTHKQTTDGNIYTTGYKYNLRGDITEQTYPSGRVVKTTLDSNGGVATAESQKNAQSSFKKYASQFVYNSTGTIASMKLGNGLFETAKYNNRLQAIEMGLGNSTSTTNLWKVNYNYGTIENNGNIKSQTVNSGSVVFNQSYQYDSLNRITEAKEVSNSVETWKQTFGYDRFGNRTQFSQVIENQQFAINNQTLPQVDIANNRFTTGQGYEYDLNGNIIKDTQNRQFTFDGNNKQTEVKNANNQVIGNYFYDGEGSRVKKVTATETVIFVYNAVKQLVAEYSTQVNTNPQVTYLTNDNLGTPRIKTNAQGQTISRNDYLPFGENLYTSQRTATSKYGVQDNVKQGFTGYERDGETGLDYAKARYYNNQYGRFTAVDPMLASGISANPQTFNRYAYALANPLRFVDKTGEYNVDVHQFLTMALAYASGFSLYDSYMIGVATQHTDDDPNKQPMWGLSPDCTCDATGYGRRRDYHFTTSGRRAELWSLFEENSAYGNRDSAITGLGDYLHSQEDSYSHAGFGPGVGQTPAGFYYNYRSPEGLESNGVPGWSRAYAEAVDITTNDPKKAEKMAQDIFGRLLVAREVMDRDGTSKSGEDPFGLFKTNTPLKFEDIRAATVAFIMAKKDTDEEIEAATIALFKEIMKIQENKDRDPPARGYG